MPAKEVSGEQTAVNRDSQCQARSTVVSARCFPRSHIIGQTTDNCLITVTVVMVPGYSSASEVCVIKMCPLLGIWKLEWRPLAEWNVYRRENFALVLSQGA